METNQLIDIIVNRVLSEINSTQENILLVSDSKQVMQNEEHYLDYDENKSYQKYIIDYLSLKECACLIHEIKYNQKIDFILKQYNKKTFAINNVEESDQVLSNIYQEQLRKKGFVFSKKIEPKIEQRCSEVKETSIDKKIISERDLINMQLKKNTSLIIKGKVIITPLAYDYIRNNNIKIIKEE